MPHDWTLSPRVVSDEPISHLPEPRPWWEPCHHPPEMPEAFALGPHLGSASAPAELQSGIVGQRIPPFPAHDASGVLLRGRVDACVAASSSPGYSPGSIQGLLLPPRTFSVPGSKGLGQGPGPPQSHQACCTVFQIKGGCSSPLRCPSSTGGPVRTHPHPHRWKQRESQCTTHVWGRVSIGGLSVGLRFRHTWGHRGNVGAGPGTTETWPVRQQGGGGETHPSVVLR